MDTQYFSNMGKRNKRKMFGPTNDSCMWRRRTNQGLQTMYRDIDIISDIKIRRLEWVR